MRQKPISATLDGMINHAKKLSAALFCWLCCLSPVAAQAAADTLQFQLNGLAATPELLENANNALLAERARRVQTAGHALTADEIKNFYDNSPGVIRNALQPFGYFRPSIKLPGLTHPEGHWQMTFNIQPGVRLKITAVHVSIIGAGHNDPALQKLATHFPLHRGMPFDTNNYEKARDSLQQLANQQGYLHATLVQKEVRIDLVHYTADIQLQLDTGSRYYFGALTFTPTPLNERFLQRFAPFKSGQPFSSAQLLTLQQNLNKSGYFRQVAVLPAVDQASQNHVPTQINLQMKKQQAYSFSGGYGSFTGPRVKALTDFRFIGHNGQHMTLDAQLSATLKGLSAKYYFPGKNPLTDQYVVGAEIQKFVPDKEDESLSENFSVSRIKAWHDWQYTLSLNYLIEHYVVTTNDASTADFGRVLYPGIALSWLTADNLIDPHSARSISLVLRGASEHALSYNSFVQSEIKGKFFFSPTQYSRLILRGNIGYTIVKDLAHLPLTLRFFAGGPNSVRGYPYATLGPGRYLETGSIELQHTLHGNLSGAIFYDIGNAFDHIGTPLMQGDGVGLVYHSIIGPVAFYVARAESKKGKPLQVEFSIGSSFG